MPPGKKIKMYYDPRGNVIRTVNPDNSEQWVVYGKPNTLSSIAINNSWSFKNYAPTPWCYKQIKNMTSSLRFTKRGRVEESASLADLFLGIRELLSNS